MATRNTGALEKVLAQLNRLNRTTVFLVTLGIMLVGLFLPGFLGAVVLLALAGFLGWLLARTWPYVPGSARAIRLIVLALIVIAAVRKL